MSITARPYAGQTDLHHLQRATADWIRLGGFEGRININDIALRLFNGMRNHDPSQLIQLWEDANGQLIGWSLIYPDWCSFEVQVHPQYRQKQLEAEMLEWAEHETIKWLQRLGREDEPIVLDVFGGDAQRIALLERRGYSRAGLAGTIATCQLSDAIPSPKYPRDFEIRATEGVKDAPQMVALINDSFDWRWAVSDYQQVLQSPAFENAIEMVVVAPNNQFAATCIILPDEHNQMFMFENVGTSPQFRRMGLAKALLLTGMFSMKDQGFTLAQVPYRLNLDAAPRLYESVGFRPTYDIYSYTK